MNFNLIKNAVAFQFNKMSKLDLFETSVDKDFLWETYLNSFPEGTNPIFRKRTEHDCSTCRNFIKRVGRVVNIIDNKMVSIWDVKVSDANYQIVCDKMSKTVKEYIIENVFITGEKVAGIDKTFEHIIDRVQTWQHFFVNIPNKFVINNKDIGTQLGVYKTNHDMLKRALSELTDDAIETVIDLHNQGSLARSGEYIDQVKKFKIIKKEYNRIKDRDTFIWNQIIQNNNTCRIKNTAIGTLLSDLSEGKDINMAVRSYVNIVDPTNFCRTTAPVTASMVAKAKEKIESLGLLSALERRFANIDDLDVNNILYINNDPNIQINPDPFGEIKTVNKKNKFDNIETITIDKFLTNILPNTKNIEVYMEPKLKNNLVSLITSQDPTANNMFKWNNNFSWAYNNDVTDSIKERVKQAGGNVTGELCCRLSWFNYDDLDLHMREPNEGRIYYMSKQSKTTGGELDVDMNAGHGTTRTPVENIFYKTTKNMTSGRYNLSVHNYNKRENTNIGFEVEIDFKGSLYQFKYESAVLDKQYIMVAEFDYDKKSDSIKFIHHLPFTTLSGNGMVDIWNVKSNNFNKVKAITMSPNFWNENQIGNKHFMFWIDNCINPDEPRGFFNEYLRSDLHEHRKTLEMLGDKTRVKPSNNQLSGLGFSISQKGELVVKVEGFFSRVLKIVF